MSISLAVNLIILVASFAAAWLDHGETVSNYRSAVGRIKSRYGLKVSLLWGVPFLSLIALAAGLKESSVAENELHGLRTNLTAIEARTKVAPLPQRIAQLLDSFDPEIMKTLANTTGPLTVQIILFTVQEAALKKISSDEGADHYITIDEGYTGNIFFGKQGLSRELRFVLNTNLIGDFKSSVSNAPMPRAELP